MSVRDRFRLAGITLLEVLITLAVVGIAISIAIPAFSSMRETIRLKGAVNLVSSDLRLAQSEAQKRRRTVTFNVQGDGDTWCYGLNLDTSCDCSTSGSCTLDGIEKVVRQVDRPGVSVSPAVSNGHFSFRPQRQTVTAGHVKILSNESEVRVVLSGYGRIRECSPGGDSFVSAFPRC